MGNNSLVVVIQKQFDMATSDVSIMHCTNGTDAGCIGQRECAEVNVVYRVYDDYYRVALCGVAKTNGCKQNRPTHSAIVKLRSP